MEGGSNPLSVTRNLFSIAFDEKKGRSPEITFKWASRTFFLKTIFGLK